MRYTRYVRAEIDRAIHDANIANLSHKQCLQFVKERTGHTIKHAQLVERKRILRHRAMDLWNQYRKDDYVYRLEHLQRMNEAKLVKDQAVNKMLEFYDDPKKFFHWKQAAYALIEASKYLSELHAMIPEIDGIGHEMGDLTEEIQPPEKQGEMGTLSQAKF